MDDQVYIRNAAGDTYLRSVREGLKEFLDPDIGYRISFNIEGVVITLRRDMQVDSDMKFIDEHIENQTSLDCAVTIRGTL